MPEAIYLALAIVSLGATIAAIFLLRAAWLRIAELEEEKTHCHEAMKDARTTFREYRALHLAKGTADGKAKARANAACADALDRAMKRTGYREDAWAATLERLFGPAKSGRSTNG